MKTLTVSQAKARLGKLVEEVYAGEPVLLAHHDKLVKLERFEVLDPEEDTPELEAELLKAVEGPHAPYSGERLRARLDHRIRQRRRRRK